MQTLSGFVKMHRKLIQWGWYQDSIVKCVFLHLLLTANFKDSQWMGISVKRGQVVIGTNKLADELGISRQQLRTALNKLKSTNEITIKSTNKFTLVTVVNWDNYQCEDEIATSNLTSTSTNEQPTDNQRATNEQPQRKNDKNDKNDKNKKSIGEKRSVFTPPTLEQVKEYCVERKNGVDAERFIDFYSCKGWMVGKNKMKDWKAAVRTWERGDSNGRPGTSKKLEESDNSKYNGLVL